MRLSVWVADNGQLMNKATTAHASSLYIDNLIHLSQVNCICIPFVFPRIHFHRSCSTTVMNFIWQ